MKQPNRMKCTGLRRLGQLALLILLGVIALAQPVIADVPAPGTHDWLDHWSFDNTNTWHSDLGYAPRSFTNVAGSPLGNWNALVLDSTNAAWLNYNVTESGGTNHLTVDRGTVLFWFAPSWSGTNAGGAGPGQWGRLIEVGSSTTNASYGWWSLYLDPAGVNLYFSSQTNNGSQANYLSAPISWTTNYWHMLALTYSATNTSLYLDGQLATNASGITYRPGPNVLTNGFYIGSDSNGLAQARGMYDDLYTYNYPLNAATIGQIYEALSLPFYGNPMNAANISSAPSSPTFNAFAFSVITGSGYLTPVSTNTVNCLTNNTIWITNVSALATNGKMSVTFSIAGGSGAVPYDVFANSVLDFSTSTNYPWAWLGQGYHCVTYTLTNLPSTACFLILGTPRDSDGDGLTDAYERLVTKTRTDTAFSSTNGIPEAWLVLHGMNPQTPGIAGQDPDSDALFNLSEYLYGTDPHVSQGFGIWVSSPNGSNLP